MSEVEDAFRRVREQELAGMAVGQPSAASKVRFERGLNLVAAGKVIDRLEPRVTRLSTRHEVDPDTGRRLAVHVPRFRSATAVIPQGFGGGDAPEKTIHLEETRTKIYRPWPFGMYGVWPRAIVSSVNMTETADGSKTATTVTGSNRIGFAEEDPNGLEELVDFSHTLELIARAAGFYRELTVANDGLFLPDGYAAMRAH